MKNSVTRFSSALRKTSPDAMLAGVGGAQVTKLLSFRYRTCTAQIMVPEGSGSHTPSCKDYFFPTLDLWGSVKKQHSRIRVSRDNTPRNLCLSPRKLKKPEMGLEGWRRGSKWGREHPGQTALLTGPRKGSLASVDSCYPLPSELPCAPHLQQAQCLPCMLFTQPF